MIPREVVLSIPANSGHWCVVYEPVESPSTIPDPSESPSIATLATDISLAITLESAFNTNQSNCITGSSDITKIDGSNIDRVVESTDLRLESIDLSLESIDSNLARHCGGEFSAYASSHHSASQDSFAELGLERDEVVGKYMHLFARYRDCFLE